MIRTRAYGARRPGANYNEGCFVYMMAMNPEEDQRPSDGRAGGVGATIDRSAIRELLKLTPAERARLAVAEARNLEAALSKIRPRVT